MFQLFTASTRQIKQLVEKFMLILTFDWEILSKDKKVIFKDFMTNNSAKSMLLNVSNFFTI